MKRALSLVLAAALVLGSVPAGFAATATAGETLKGYGLVAGDTNGNLNEDKTITRGEMMVVLARLLGKFEEAKAYSIPSTSKDVAGHWAANYIAYAEKEGWTAGKGNGMFDPQGTVTLQEVSVFMLKALGYTADWNTAVKAATDLGLLKEVVAKDAAAKVLRSDVFTSALNTINTPVKDTTVKLGVKLGVLKADVVATVVLDTAKALSFKLVEVKLTADAKEVKAADFAVTDADGKAVEVKAATLIDSKTVWLDTADQVAGKIYTVKVADKTAKYTGVAKDSSSPVVQGTSKVMDNVTVKVVFDKEVDPRTALVAANYTIDNNLQVTKAAWNTDKDGDAIKTEVLLTTSAQTSGTLYKLTVATKVTDLAGNAVKSADDANIVKFGGIKADTAAPKLTSAMGKNAVKVVLTFDEPSGLDKATAENVANYTLTNKTDAAKTATVTKAELKQDSSDVWNTVELTTSAQTVGNIYEVAVKNVADKFGNVISTTADYKTTFSGQPADTTAPQVVTVEVKTNTSVKVTFNEELDKAAAETVANYAINNNLTVVKAALDSTKKIVTLTTSSQTAGTAYKVTVSNVTDEYANKIGSSNNSGFFSGLAVDDKKPSVLSAIASVDGSKTFVTVTFSEGMNDTAKVASNYFFGDAVGYGVEVTKVSDAVYKVRVNALEDLKNYTVKVTGVEDASANGIDTDKNTANFVGKTTADEEAPKVVGAVAVDKNTIQVLFSRPVKTSATTAAANTATHLNGVTADASDVMNYQLVEKGSTTNLITDYAKAISYVAKDRKSVTLRFQTGSGVSLAAGKVYEVYVNGDADVTGITFGAPALVADNNKEIAKADSYATMGSNTAESTQPEMVAAYAVNTTVLNIKFNTPIVYTKSADGDIKIGTFDNDMNNTTVSTTDNTVLVVKSKTALVAGTVYTVTINTPSTITDIYKDLSAKASVTQKLTAPSTTNEAPAIASVQTLSNTSLKVTFTKDLGNGSLTSSAANKFVLANFKVNGTNATHVAYDGTAKNAIIVHFNPNGLTAGNVYEFKLIAGGVVDTVNAPTTKDLTADFASSVTSSVSDDARVVPKISDVVKVSDDTIRLTFNKPVAKTAAVLAATDFTVSTFTPGSIKAYFNGSDVTSTAGLAAGRGNFQYVDSIDLTLDRVVPAGVTTNVDFAAVGGWRTMDGAVNVAAPKAYTGTLASLATIAQTTAGVLGTTAEVNTITVSATGNGTYKYEFKDGTITTAITLTIASTDTKANIATAIAAALNADSGLGKFDSAWTAVATGDTVVITSNTTAADKTVTFVAK